MRVLDTSALAPLMRNEQTAIERLRDLPPEEVVLCAPVAAEIAYGLERLVPGSRRRALLSERYRQLRVVLAWRDWTEPAAHLYGAQKQRLMARGISIQDMDLAIASVALALGAAVATCNLRHFSRIEGLAVEDWSSRR